MKMFWRKTKSPAEQARKQALAIIYNPYYVWVADKSSVPEILLLEAFTLLKEDFDRLNGITADNLASVLVSLEGDLEEVACGLQNAENKLAQAVGLICRYRMHQEHDPELLLEKAAMLQEAGYWFDEAMAVALPFIEREALQEWFARVLQEKPGDYYRQSVACAWGQELRMTELAPVSRNCLHIPEFKAVYHAAVALRSFDAINLKSLIVLRLNANTVPAEDRTLLKDLLSLP